MLSALNYLNSTVAAVAVVTRSPDSYAEKDRSKIEECIELLKSHGITVKTQDRVYQKFAVMDQRIVWYGSVNLFSYGASDESIMRIESADIAAELIEMV